MVRWINLGLAVVLAALLVMELTRSGLSEETPAPAAAMVRSGVAKEKPARRAKRVEARMALEEARRRQLERGKAPTGMIELGPDGLPYRD